MNERLSSYAESQISGKKIGYAWERGDYHDR